MQFLLDPQVYVRRVLITYLLHFSVLHQVSSQISHFHELLGTPVQWRALRELTFVREFRTPRSTLSSLRDQRSRHFFRFFIRHFYKHRISKRCAALRCTYSRARSLNKCFLLKPTLFFTHHIFTRCPVYQSTYTRGSGDVQREPAFVKRFLISRSTL